MSKEMEDLEEKLVKWVGIKPHETISFFTGEVLDKESYPDFTNDPNACLEVLVPKLLETYNIASYWFKQLTTPDLSSLYYYEVNVWKKGSTKHGFEILQDEHIAKVFEQGKDLQEITALAIAKVTGQVIDKENSG